MVRRSLTPSLVVIAAALSSMGCASSPSPSRSSATPDAAEAGDAASSGIEAADDGGAAPKGGSGEDGTKTPSTVTSTLSGESDEESKPTSARRELTTVAEALDAFEEDEIRLADLLEGKKATALDAGACGSICDALASMRRASDAICDLAGEDDPRCEKAREKLAGNEKRIEGRGCRCSP